MSSCIVVPTTSPYKRRLHVPALKLSLLFIPEHFALPHNTGGQLLYMRPRLGLTGYMGQPTNGITPSLHPTK